MRPTVTISSGTPITQFGTMSFVAFKNLAAIWFSTCPLKGIAAGKTTSNAEILSVTTIAIKRLSMVYTSRTFPL
ncbi:hypothetical protein D3C86_950080 [compost metagenome]